MNGNVSDLDLSDEDAEQESDREPDIIKSNTIPDDNSSSENDEPPGENTEETVEPEEQDQSPTSRRKFWKKTDR